MKFAMDTQQGTRDGNRGAQYQADMQRIVQALKRFNARQNEARMLVASFIVLSLMKLEARSRSPEIRVTKGHASLLSSILVWRQMLAEQRGFALSLPSRST